MSTQSSEWGKLNQGQAFVPFAMDVARAVFAVGLGEHQASLFWHLIEHCWSPARKGRTHSGYADPVGYAPKLAELSKAWEVPLPRLSAAKKWLLDAKMIYEAGGELWVNKAADTWVNPGTSQPLLSPVKLAYAAGARSRTRKRNDDESVTVNRNLDAETEQQASVTVSRNLEPAEVTVDRNSEVGAVTVNRKSGYGQPYAPVTVNRNLAHYEEPARQEFKREEEVGGGEVPPPPPASTPAMKPDPDGPEAAEVLRIATKRWGASNGDRIIGDFLIEFPAAWVKHAMDAMQDSLKGRIDSRYLRKILNRYRAIGGPDEEESDGFRLASSPAAKSKPKTPDRAFDPNAYLRDLMEK